MSTGRAVLALLAVAIAAGGGCRPALRPAPPPAPPLVRVAAVPALTDDGGGAALADAVRASLAYYARLRPDATVRFGDDAVTAAAMTASLRDLLALLAAPHPPADLAAEIDRRFLAYRATAPAGVLFTGYYLPTIAARPSADAAFRVPILGRPPDFVTAALGDFHAECAAAPSIAGRLAGGQLVPYPTRAAIASGAAPAPVLAWTDDPVGLFFLQIQGSGFLRWPDGSARTIGFAASNGHPYVSIGKHLIERGELSADAASMQGIRRWVAAHPDERDRLLATNPRYVFFRVLDGPALGGLGVPVTAGRTIATDPAVYPPGALAFIRLPSTAPATSEAPRPLSRLALNQDAGAAIRGAGRVDVFFGAGEEAEAVAGGLKAHGELYFLAPRQN